MRLSGRATVRICCRRGQYQATKPAATANAPSSVKASARLTVFAVGRLIEVFLAVGPWVSMLDLLLSRWAGLALGLKDLTEHAEGLPEVRVAPGTEVLHASLDREVGR